MTAAFPCPHCECSWCGAECSPSGPRDRDGNLFCGRAHRDASTRAVRRLRFQEGKERWHGPAVPSPNNCGGIGIEVTARPPKGGGS